MPNFLDNLTSTQGGLNTLKDIATAPPPSISSGAENKAFEPISVNPTGLNLGQILQPLQGSPQNGFYGAEVASPMGSYTSAGISTRTALVGGSVLIIGVAFVLLIRRKG